MHEEAQPPSQPGRQRAALAVVVLPTLLLLGVLSLPKPRPLEAEPPPLAPVPIQTAALPPSGPLALELPNARGKDLPVYQPSRRPERPLKPISSISRVIPPPPRPQPKAPPRMASVAAYPTAHRKTRETPSPTPTPDPEGTVAPADTPTPAPRQDLNLSGELSNGYLLANGQPKLVYLLVEAKFEDKAAAQTVPINLALVVDKSGSMNGEKLRNAIEGVVGAMRLLRRVDKCSLVVFADQFQTFPHATAGAAEHSILAASVGGGTVLAPGLRAAVQLVRKDFNSEHFNHIIVLTDGVTRDPDDCLREAAAGVRERISISTIGLGNDCDTAFLGKIADNSNGNFHFVDAPSKLPDVYAAELKMLKDVMLRNNRIKVRLFPGVSIRHAYRLRPGVKDLGEPEAVHNVVTVPLGDLRLHESTAVLFELSLTAAQPGQRKVAEAQVEHDVFQEGLSPVSSVQNVEVQYTYDTTKTRAVNTRVLDSVDAILKAR